MQSEKRKLEKEKSTSITKKGKKIPTAGFEPAHTNIFELESNPLDRSGKLANDTPE